MKNCNHDKFDSNESIDREYGWKKCTDCNSHKIYVDFIEEDNSKRVKVILGFPRIVGKDHLLFRGWGRSNLDLCEKIDG